MNVIPLSSPSSWLLAAKAALVTLIVAVVTCGVLYAKFLQRELADTTAKLAKADATVISMTGELASLADQRRQLEVDLAAAKKRSATLRADADRKTKEILAAPVPSDCAGAAAWAIEQAGSFK